MIEMDFIPVKGICRQLQASCLEQASCVRGFQTGEVREDVEQVLGVALAQNLCTESIAYTACQRTVCCEVIGNVDCENF